MTPAAPVAAAPAPEPKPAPAPAPAAEAAGNSQDDIDALFDFAVPEEDLSKPASQDDIDALFD